MCNILYIATIILLSIFSILMILFVPNKACADSLDLNITSWHSDKSYGYNNQNYGLGYTKDLNHHWQVQGGYFKNSFNKDSLYALLNIKHEMKGWNFGIAAGFITGYDDIDIDKKYRRGIDSSERSEAEIERHSKKHDKNIDKYKYRYNSHTHPENMNSIQFMVLPNITWKITKKHALNLTYVPSFNKDTFSFAGLKYQYKLQGY